MQKGPRNSILELFTLKFLEDVVKQIPLGYHRDLALVSKDFYNVVCDVDKNKYYVSLSGEQLKDRSIVLSVMNSGRVFDYLGVVFHSFGKNSMTNMIAIVKKHGSNVKTLNFHRKESGCNHYVIDAKDLTTFFKNLPNLNEWIISGFHDFFIDIVGDHEPVIKSLKKLTAYEDGLSDQLLQKLLLFIAADTVEHLYMVNVFDYNKFIQHQRNLKSLESYDEWYSNDFLKYTNVLTNLKLEEIKGDAKYCDDHYDSLKFLQLIREQENLQKVDLKNMPMDSTLIETICYYSCNLRFLSLTVTNGNIASLLGIHQLEELQELKITVDEDFSRVDLFTELVKLEMPSIKKVKFKIGDSDDNGDDNFDFNPFLATLGIHWENIEQFTVAFRYKSTLNNIFENFPNLKTLTFKGENELVFEIDNSTYPLIETLDSRWSTCSLPICLLEALPNLHYLHMRGCVYEGAPHIDALLKLQKLKKLLISFNVNPSIVASNSREVSGIKKLCQSLTEFEISFSTSKDSPFTDQLEAQLQNEHYIKLTREQQVLELKNFKY